MVMKIKKIISIVFLLAVCLFANAQPETQDTTKQLYVITKIDGMEYIGEILTDDGREVLLNTDELGNIYIRKSDIKSIVKIEDMNDIKFGEFRAMGPFTTRYSFTNNAHPVTRGENYALLNLYGPEVHFALTDYFSLGVMSTWIASPFIVAMKYSIPTSDPKLNFSIGTLVGTSGYLNTFRGYGGLHWANITLGDRMRNFTLGAGYAYFDSGSEDMMEEPGIYYDIYPNETIPFPVINGPMASVAWTIKVGAKVSFVFDSMFMYFNEEFSRTEEYYTQGYYDNVTNQWVDPRFRINVTLEQESGFVMMFLPGLRFQKNEKRAFQCTLAGVVYNGNENISFPFPMCTWFFRF